MRCLFTCLLFIISGCAAAAIPSVGDVSAVDAAKPFTIDDYFNLQKVTELAISSDGEMMAYAVTQQSLAENKPVRTVFVSATTPGARIERIDVIQSARGFAWIPGGHELAFLSSVDGAAQVLSIDPKTRETRQHTHARDAVTAFRFAPDGASLAWLTQSSEKPTVSLYDRLFHSDEGVVIDPEHTTVYEFVNPKWSSTGARSSNELWFKRAAERDARRVNALGRVSSFYWSSDAEFLSIAYADRDMPHVAFVEKYTSLGVFNVTTEEFKVLARGRTLSEKDNGLIYSGGEWVPGEYKLFIRLTEQEDRWAEKMQWSLFNLADDSAADSELRSWRPMTDMYGWNPEPAFLPVNETKIYSERTVRAHPSLYEITPSEPVRAAILENVEGAISSIGFSADFQTAIFVNENLDRPPEIYIWRNGHGVTQLTRLNNEIAAKLFPHVKEIHWQSKDGVTVQGWLLEPVGEIATSNNKPWPLVTFVHGGPGVVFSNEFAFYFSATRMWPYSFDVYPLNGMAVFFPNYRGTGTFGYGFRHPGAIDEEPADDIITGIDYLVREGVADPARLAISGHSHGAWLAPLVMTKAKYFKAASFGEGTLNKLINYNMMPGWLNREVHDIQNGASLYDDPARYIELSPDMHFKGLDTATLFEAGAESLAINMMGSHKAAVRAGMPAEFVVYPKTDHGSSTPQMQYEGAHRNLDWMRFWLLGEEDTSTDKAAQYERWREMREQRCARDDLETPSYCAVN